MDLKVIIVSTLTDKALNADGQHDPAGNWAVVPSKNPHTQIKAAEGIEYLAHLKDGELVNVYRVAGFHTERRDQVQRVTGQQSPVKISVGIRFHLRTLPEGFESTIAEAVSTLGLKGIRGCKTVNVSV